MTGTLRQYSRKPRPFGTLVAQLDLLRRFANLRDGDVESFRAQHPDFFVAPALTEDGWIEGVVHRLGGGGPRLVSVRALMLAETIAKAQPDRALRIRELLRCIWRGDENADDYLKILLSGSRMRFNWRRGELEYAPENELEEAVYALFRNSSLAKVCENPECPAKYFIAQRKSQRYCGEECASVYQREWKRKWWKKKGAKLRSEQRRQKEKRKGDGN